MLSQVAHAQLQPVLILVPLNLLAAAILFEGDITAPLANDENPKESFSEDSTENSEGPNQNSTNVSDLSFETSLFGFCDGPRMPIKALLKKVLPVETRTNKLSMNYNLRVRIKEDPDGLEELPSPENTIPKGKSNGIFPWLKRAYITSRGFEMGNFDGSFLASTMKIQSTSWETIAMATSETSSAWHTSPSKSY